MGFRPRFSQRLDWVVVRCRFIRGSGRPTFYLGFHRRVSRVPGGLAREGEVPSRRRGIRGCRFLTGLCQIPYGLPRDRELPSRRGGFLACLFGVGCLGRLGFCQTPCGRTRERLSRRGSIQGCLFRLVLSQIRSRQTRERSLLRRRCGVRACLSRRGRGLQWSSGRSSGSRGRLLAPRQVCYLVLTKTAMLTATVILCSTHAPRMSRRGVTGCRPVPCRRGCLTAARTCPRRHRWTGCHRASITGSSNPRGGQRQRRAYPRQGREPLRGTARETVREEERVREWVG